MDDTVVWGRSRRELQTTLTVAQDFAEDQLALCIKPTWQLQRTSRGLTFCGYRIFPHRLGLTLRRRRRYRQVRAKWEAKYHSGQIGDLELQAGYAAALALIRGTDAEAWLGRQLQTTPALEV